MKLADRFLDIVLVLVFLYLVVVNFQGSTSVIRQTGSSTTNIIKALQGR